MANVKNWIGNPRVPINAGSEISPALLDGTGSDAWITGKSPPSVILFSNPAVISDNMLVADFTPCVFTGYAALPFTGVAYLDPNGNPYIGTAAQLVWTAGAIGTADIAYGYAILNTGGTLVIAAELFDTPYGFNTTGDILRLTPRIPMLYGQGGLVD